MKISIGIALAFGALLLLGCEDKSAAPQTTSTSTTSQAKPTNTTTAAAPATNTAAQAAAADDLPTEEEFEEQAEKDITADNLEAELGKLEKEIGQ